jgi:hypothetical protein
MSENKEKPKESKVMPAVGVDVGTANIVVARRAEDGSFVVKHHRNMLFEMDVSDEATDLLEKGHFLYLKSGTKYYIVGEDALRLVNAIGRGDIIRPMRNGLLNPELKKAQDLLFYILKAVVGAPLAEKETLRFTVPADPVDKPNVNNKFHQMVLQNFFDSLGFSSKPINEALANLYNEAPVMKVEGEEDSPLTGYSVSFGAGMVNSCFALRGMSLVEFSNTQCGDHIDEQVSTVTGEPVGRVIRAKEKRLDLDHVDPSDRVLMALSIYYDEMIGRVVKGMARKLAEQSREFEGSVEVVVCGGSAMAPGFLGRMQKIVSQADLPFKVREVRMSSIPFFSVSHGCCLAAQSDWKKRKEA